MLKNIIYDLHQWYFLIVINMLNWMNIFLFCCSIYDDKSLQNQHKYLFFFYSTFNPNLQSHQMTSKSIMPNFLIHYFFYYTEKTFTWSFLQTIRKVRWQSIDNISFYFKYIKKYWNDIKIWITSFFWSALQFISYWLPQWLFSFLLILIIIKNENY